MIKFTNDGVMDVRSITAFGVSSKENDDAIGYFGTGLKYAIAIILRHGCSIQIDIDGKQHKFGVERSMVRVNEFDFVTMDGNQLSFTTDLGKNWELWMAFRELYCNCTDEKGVIERAHDIELSPEKGKTVIKVVGTEFENIFGNINDFIINKNRPVVYESDAIRIYEGQSRFVFYKGVRILNMDSTMKYTYDIKSYVSLTEDRTASYPSSVRHDIGTEISKMENEGILSQILLVGELYGEHELSMRTDNSDEFKEVCRKAAERFDKKLNPSARSVYKDWVDRALQYNSNYHLNEVENMRLERAIEFCKFIGYKVDTYPINFSEFLGEGVLACAYKDEIYISKRVFSQGTKQVAMTLLEEYLHLKQKLEDETYSFQTYLFDIIGDIGERLQGEPL